MIGTITSFISCKSLSATELCVCGSYMADCEKKKSKKKRKKITETRIEDADSSWLAIEMAVDSKSLAAAKSYWAELVSADACGGSASQFSSFFFLSFGSFFF